MLLAASCCVSCGARESRVTSKAGKGAGWCGLGMDQLMVCERLTGDSGCSCFFQPCILRLASVTRPSRHRASVKVYSAVCHRKRREVSEGNESKRERTV